MSAAKEPQLPIEFLTKIISHLPIKDCGSTWLNCRPVSRTWKSATEEVFIRRHVPKLCVHFDLGWGPLRRARQSLLQLEFVFHSLSPDRNRVVMRDPTAPGHPIWLPVAKRRWANTMADYPTHGDYTCDQRIFHPAHIVSLRRMANDVELPGLEEYDAESLTLSFEWAKLLSMYFGEEAYTEKLLEADPVMDRSKWPKGPIWDPELLIKTAMGFFEKTEKAKERLRSG
ncbi:hypothetical protein N658DRAFT_495999 [Parathielavia hyrcaniae]|uniref:F-box domain-containing protein n=1 Tax=Parathielavia hyrcaniae TaxID=113614 RepID=A0AAN6Q6B5_9PEZI|nr:hypothetical protein N658DRAFT_495999 [Parathielavia hyrcaniae]